MRFQLPKHRDDVKFYVTGMPVMLPEHGVVQVEYCKAKPMPHNTFMWNMQWTFRLCPYEFIYNFRDALRLPLLEDWE